MDQFKKIVSIAALASLVALTAFIARYGYAQSAELPSKMDPIDAAQLDAALAHIREIQSKMQIEAQPFAARAKTISEKYRIDLEHGDTVDLTNGAIKRAAKGAGK